METLIAVNASLVGLFAFAAIHYSVIWWFSRNERVLLVFTIQCVIYIAICFVMVSYFRSRTVPEAQAWLDRLMTLGAIVHAVVLHFYAMLGSRRDRGFRGLVVGVMAFLAVLSVWVPLRGTVIRLQTAQLPWGATGLLPILKPPGVPLGLLYLAVMAIYIYGLFVAGTIWKRNRAGAVLVAAASLTILAGATIGVLIDFAKVRAPYVGPLPHAIFVVFMGLYLSREYAARGLRLVASESRAARSLREAQEVLADLEAANRRREESETARHNAMEALRGSHAELEQQTRQLRRLASQLTLTEQNVRKQLASTLHDGLQQLLFSAAMRLDEVVTSSCHDGQAELLQRVQADIKEALEAARTLSVNLFPPVLHLSGLPAALTWLAKRTQEQYSVAVNLTADPQANPEASEVRILLFECVRELLFNAVKHADVDSIDVNLGVAPDETVQIRVSDDGIGFNPTISPDDKNQQGGLGLFSIRERLSLLGGHLQIESAPGSGSRFTLMLPRNGRRRATNDMEAPRDGIARPERPVENAARGTSKSLGILISDDHAVVRAGLRDLFGKHPQLQVVGEATNGVEAITQAVALQPDIIVMDVSMPEMNGIDATREIHRTLPHIRIVGLSTHHDESTERLMRNAGAEAYHTKDEGADRLLDYLLSLRGKAKGASQI